MKLLHIDSSILGDHSGSRQVTAAIVKQLHDKIPSLIVTYRDLAVAPLPHLTLAHLPTSNPMVDASKATSLNHESQAALEEFLAADIIVIGAPMYNFTISSQLKSWIDRIMVTGQTFKYGANGPEGLMGGKRVIVSIVRGGMYSAGSPAESYEHAEMYLRTALGFIGITNPEIIIAEGVAMGPEVREKAIAAALSSVSDLAA